MKALLFLLVLIPASNAFTQTAVDSTGIVSIGGIRQYISVKGVDNSKPLLLFLHGGPGGSVMHYSQKFTTQLEEHFVVVQWDQRETGKTLELNTSPVPLTVQLFENDCHDLITLLLLQFNQQKLYLVGHSWGSALGFCIARKYPELLHAFVPVGAMVNQIESERIILDLMMEKAIRDNNKHQIAELKSIKIPFETGEDLYRHRKWLFNYVGSKTKLSQTYVVQWASRWLALYNEACTFNLPESLPEVNCPVYFFAGRKDYQTNSWLAEKYYQKMIAPKKGFFWFERSAHAIPTTEPTHFQNILITKILPATHPGL